MRIALVMGVLLLLTGCMEALQSSPAAGVTPFAPPAPRPTQTAATAAAGPTAEAGEPAAETASTGIPPSDTVAPANSAPALATEAATAPPIASPAPIPTIVLATPVGLSNEERWRAQQEQREIFPALQPYTTIRSELWWYDPVNQQSVVLGSFNGDFPAQARFILRSTGQEALEVPYQVNASYGLTALSPAVIDRIRAAGFSEWVETFVYLTPEVQPR